MLVHVHTLISDSCAFLVIKVKIKKNNKKKTASLTRAFLIVFCKSHTEIGIEALQHCCQVLT